MQEDPHDEAGWYELLADEQIGMVAFEATEWPDETKMVDGPTYSPDRVGDAGFAEAILREMARIYAARSSGADNTAAQEKVGNWLQRRLYQEEPVPKPKLPRAKRVPPLPGQGHWKASDIRGHERMVRAVRK